MTAPLLCFKIASIGQFSWWWFLLTVPLDFYLLDFAQDWIFGEITLRVEALEIRAKELYGKS